MFKGSTLAKFSDNIAIIGGVVDILEGKGIGVIQFSENTDLVLNQRSTVMFQVAYLNYFDRHWTC